MGDTQTLHQPLDPERAQFRLLQIQHDQADEISCRLEIFSVLDEPNYKALSYVWGTDHASQRISVNGCSFRIRQNLYDYLKLAKQKVNTDWLFVDAICIDQLDYAEKSGQIALMGDIYRNAKEVIAWIGLRTDAGKILLRRNPELESIEAADKVFNMMMARFGELHDSHVDCGMIFNASETSAELYHPLMVAFLQYSYWTRLWIVPEITLATRLIFMCRSICITPELLEAGIKWIMDDKSKDRNTSDETLENPVDLYLCHLDVRSRSFSNENSYPLLRIICSFLQFRRRYQDDLLKVSESAIPLLEAVTRTAGQQCSLPFDRLFGLLGLTHSHLSVDYSLPVTELYLHILIEVLLQHAGLSFETSATRSPMLYFCSSLLTSLDLSMSNPTIVLLTEEALKCCGVREGDARQVVLFLSTTLAFEVSYGTKVPRWCAKPISRLLCRLGLFRLWLQRKWNGRLSAPGHRNQSKTYREWIALVGDTHESLSTKMAACGCLKSRYWESLRRQHG